MPFKKVTRPTPAPVRALLELLPGQDKETVVNWLREQGATEIESLAPGFLSVVATAETLRAAESKARVDIKRRKVMHGGE